MKSSRILSQVGVVGLVSALLVLAIAPGASARDYCENGVRIRSSPNTSSSTYGLGYPGQGMTVLQISVSGAYAYSNSCWGSGHASQWLYHTNVTTGVTGWSGTFLTR